MNRFAFVTVPAILAAAASAQTVYNTTLGIPFSVGTGNTNANFAVNTAAPGIELGLSSIYRFTGGQNSISGNIYEFNAGNTFPPVTTAAWNFNYSANLNTTGSTGLNLGNTTLFLTVDWDPTAGTNIQTYNLSAAYGGGATTIVQDSQNLGFSFWGQPFSNTALGQYVFTLSAVDNVGTTLSSIDMFVNVVPTPGAAALLGVAGLAATRRRR